MQGFKKDILSFLDFLGLKDTMCTEGVIVQCCISVVFVVELFRFIHSLLQLTPRHNWFVASRKRPIHKYDSFPERARLVIPRYKTRKMSSTATSDVTGHAFTD